MGDDALALGFGVTKPISIWNKPLKTDFKALFKTLSKAALHAATGKWPDLAGDLTDAASAANLGPDQPAELAWLLIRRALAGALLELLKDSFPPAEGKKPAEYEAICDRLDLSLE